MPESLYPKERKPQKVDKNRRWLNEYALVYGGDGGGYFVEWSKSYRTKLGSKVAAWYHYHLGSWGGSVQRFDRNAHA